MGSTVKVTVMALTGHFQRRQRIRSLASDTVLGALVCLGWAEGSLAKGYLVAEHTVGFFEILWKEGSKFTLLFFFFPNPFLIRQIRLTVSAVTVQVITSNFFVLSKKSVCRKRI